MLQCCFAVKLQKMFCGVQKLSSQQVVEKMTEFSFLGELIY